MSNELEALKRRLANVNAWPGGSHAVALDLIAYAERLEEELNALEKELNDLEESAAGPDV